MLDPKECMIVDLEQRGTPKMFMTTRIERIIDHNEMYMVFFEHAARPYSYRKGRMLYLTDPIKVDLSKKQLYYEYKHLTDIAEAYFFTHAKETFWYIIDVKGREVNLDGRFVYLTRTPLPTENPTVWGYLKHVALEVGLESLDGTNLLAKQLNMVDEYRDSVPLSLYLNPQKKAKSYSLPKTVFYPFGCNASQKKAVEAALTKQVSIIQGPPGTGKTQTVLNILANLIVSGKTVLVVSNNNSAVKNIAEKLSASEIELDFLLAQLGSSENKDHFLELQTDYPDMESWITEDPSSLLNSINETLQSIGNGFESQTKLAQLKLELNELLTEKHYNDADLVLEHQFDNWLNTRNTTDLLLFLHRYLLEVDKKKNVGLLFRIQWLFQWGWKMWPFLNRDMTVVVSYLQYAFYLKRKQELEAEIDILENELKNVQLDSLMTRLRCMSLQYWKHLIATRYTDKSRKQFNRSSFNHETEAFLKEYPIVLSTTYSAKSCINKDYVFDYVIMDEASQIDVVTGSIALSCALNAVIVGDDKQLSNVIETRRIPMLKDIEESCKIDNAYRTTENSFLQSCIRIFSEAPVTLLREHYRCHPQIIEFCNKRFYDGQLIAMTTDNQENDVLQVIQTSPGNHARGHYNQREIDVIAEEIIPSLATEDSLGIITPYRKQANEINAQLQTDVADTVHKYQGRECDSIIMSMVDNETTDFSDNPDLLNVAISRAKSHFSIVLTGNQLQPESNLSQLVDYIRYHNFEIKESKLHSVFDLLYKPYTKERLDYEKQHNLKQTDVFSESLVYNLIKQVLPDILPYRQSDVLCHYPISKLIRVTDSLSSEEKNFVENPMSHVDFLIYNPLTKRAQFCIEVDGWRFHNESKSQQERDRLKDHILQMYNLKLIRLSTVMTLTEERLKQMILDIVKN